MTDICLPYDLILISGPDAERFLQGQVSCDVSQLKENTVSYGTANTPKGRMYLLFLLARVEDGFILRAHQSIVEQALSTLGKYKVFFKCEIVPLDDYTVIGQHLDSNSELSPAPPMSIEQQGDQYVVMPTHDSSRCEIWRKSASDGCDTSDQETWFADDCRYGVPELYPETVDHFILQQLNLHELGAVSFNKGCYTGQEIIARMKFLGKLKKKMYLISSPYTDEIRPKDSLVDNDGKKIGEVVRAHFVEKNLIGLAVLDIAFVESGADLFVDKCRAIGVQYAPLHYETN